ncbi:MAG: TonB-dependent receptor [Pseudomonadota bacterium]
MLLQPGTPAAGQPMIYAIDHPQSNQPLPVPGSLGIAVGRRLELQVAVPATPGAPVAQTQGIWRPVDSLSLRAGYQQTDGSRMLLCAEADNCAPAVSANASESSLQAYALGASWQVSRALNLNVDYFSSDSQLPTNITPVWFSTAGSGLNLGSTEAVDISLTCDISAGNWGDLELGLQVSRLADFEYSLGAAQTETPLNAAAFGLGWQKGTFRGDLTSRYLDVVNGSEQTAGWTSFDVSFAWRTPWNASLSVGARNVLNNPAPASNGLSDAELENFFGRVPYVRYRQDL